MSIRHWIYISGPYSGGAVVRNVRNAIIAGLELRRAGFTPIVPHLFHLAHLVEPVDTEVWMEWNLDLLRRCDAVLRLPGASPGADREVLLAGSLDIPVITSIEAAISLFGGMPSAPSSRYTIRALQHTLVSIQRHLRADRPALATRAVLGAASIAEHVADQIEELRAENADTELLRRRALDAEAENAHLRELLVKANAAAEVKVEQLEGRVAELEASTTTEQEL